MEPRATYKVTISHPTNFHSGTVEIYVRNSPGYPGFVFCGGGNFGCSRDYRTTDDKEAIRMFMREHGCTCEKIVKVRKPKN